jgi:hypothetical protein
MLPSNFGADRAFEIYREATLDPVAAEVPQSGTIRFRDLPAAQPEGKLIGQEYEGCPGISGDMVVSAPAWPFPDMPAGTVLPLGVQQEFDRASLVTVPDNGYLQVLASSPLDCHGITTYANVTYYTSVSGAGVFSAGTLGWVCSLWGTDCGYGAGRTSSTTRSVLTATTLRLLRGMGAGPLGAGYPSIATGIPMAQSTSITAADASPVSGNAQAGGSGCPYERARAAARAAASDDSSSSAAAPDSDDRDTDDDALPTRMPGDLGILYSWSGNTVRTAVG